MELSELKSLWQTHNSEVSDQITLNKRLLKESSVNRIKSSLGEFRFENYLELIISILFVPYVAGFMLDYGESMTFMLPASIVLLVIIATIIWNIHNLYNAISLNYDESIYFQFLPYNRRTNLGINNITSLGSYAHNL